MLLFYIEAFILKPNGCFLTLPLILLRPPPPSNAPAPAPSSVDNNIVEEVIHPCNPNPCPSNHLCQVNRRGCLDELNCQPYVCVPGTAPPPPPLHLHLHRACTATLSLCVLMCASSGCKMCEASEYLVQQDARVQVPTRTGPAGCYEVCTCGPSGRLENCAAMPCVDTGKQCVVGGQKKSKAPAVSEILKCARRSANAFTDRLNLPGGEETVVPTTDSTSP